MMAMIAKIMKNYLLFNVNVSSVELYSGSEQWVGKYKEGHSGALM
jgi:hypothetical protein